MRYPFVELPGSSSGLERPVLPVELEGLEGYPFLCLIDTGALGTRVGSDIARIAGISLEDPLASDEIVVAGLRTNGRCVRVGISVGGHVVDVPVWFCDPWPFGFGLLGQEGFLRYFRVTLCTAEAWVECNPETG